MKRSRNRKGQSMLEYIIILAVFLAAVIAFAPTMRPTVDRIFTQTNAALFNTAGSIQVN